MKSNIKNVAVVGTGVIGTGWIIRCLAHDKKVVAFDKDLKLKKRLVAEIKRTWPYVKKLFNKKKLNLKNFIYVTSIQEALKEADFIQECATENYKLKTKLMKVIGNYLQIGRLTWLSLCASMLQCLKSIFQRWVMVHIDL